MYHISDIHICKDNYANILNSFNKLLGVIKKDPGILVISGDVFDTRSSLSSDDINLFHQMVRFLDRAKIHTAIIPGSHDVNPHAFHSNNNIELLIKNSAYVNCVSEYIDYSVATVWGKLDEELQGGPNIALVHGADEDRLKKLSKRFDIVAAGGEHDYRSFADNGAYSGGLVQRGAEDSIECGFVKWDLSTHRGVFVPIPQKYVYLTLTAENNLCDPFPRVRPKYIAIKHKGCTDEWLAEYMLRTRKNYKRSVNFVHDLNQFKRPKEVAKMVEDKGRLVDQVTLLKRILSGEKCADDLVDDVVGYHKKIMVGYGSDEAGGEWALKKLSWSNIYCYGENNNINFGEMDGLVSIIGQNKIGKSAIIDILIYVLFGGTVRGGISDMLNKSASVNKERHGVISCEFELEGTYVITKIIRGKRMVSVILTKNKKTLSDDPSEIQDILTGLIGGMGEFISMVTALQNRQFLVDMRKDERARLISKRLNIGFFSKIEAQVLGERKVAAAQIRRVGAQIEPMDEDEGKALKKEVKFNRGLVEQLKGDVLDYEVIMSRINQIKVRKLGELLSMRKKLVPVAKKKVDRPPKSDAAISAERRKLEKEKNIISGAIFGMPSVGSKKDWIKHFKKNGLPKLLSEIEQCRLEVSKILDLSFADDCSACSKNKVVMEDTLTKGAVAKAKLDELICIVSAGSAARLEVINKKLSELDDAQARVAEYKAFTSAKSELAKIDAEIEQSYEKASLEKKVSGMRDVELKAQDLRLAEKGLLHAEHQLQEFLEKKAVQEALVKDLTKLKREKLILDYYLKCIDGKTGIPSLMMKSACGRLTKKCCDVLGEVADFGIEIVHQKDVRIYTYDYSNDKKNLIPAEMGSGYQKFVIDMVMRIVFAEMSQAASPKLLFIDEGFGALDAAHFNSICRCLVLMQNRFRSIIVISHIAEIQTYIKNFVRVSRDARLLSTVRYGEA